MPTPKTKVTAKNRFRDLFKALNRPDGELPTILPIVSNFTSDALGDYIARFSAWREYCEDLHITAVAEFMEVRDRYNGEIDKLMILVKGEKSVSGRRAIAETDPSLTVLAQEYQDKEIYLKMIAGKLESFTNSLAILSRELTRRGLVNF